MTPRLPLALLALFLPAATAHATFSDATGTSGLFGESQSWGAQAIDIDDSHDSGDTQSCTVQVRCSVCENKTLVSVKRGDLDGYLLDGAK